MADKVYPVRVAGKIYRPDTQVRSNAGWVNALFGAHRKDVTFCLCRGEIPVVVKRYRWESDDAYSDLARWKDTGLEHEIDCRFFGQSVGAEEGGDTQPAIYALQDGRLRVHLATPIIRAEPRVPPSTGTSAQRSAGTRKTRSRASEITVLSRLWREANLNIFFGKPRDWFKTTYQLIQCAEKMVVDRKGTTLADVLLVGTQESDRMAMQHNHDVLETAIPAGERRFVLGRLSRPDWGKAKQMLRLLDFKGLPKILVETQELDVFLAPRAFARKLVDERTGYVVVLACIEPAGEDWWKVVSLTGLAVSRNMIPLESSYEQEFELYLVEQGRKFIKPMLIGEGNVEANAVSRPDFILLDTTPRTTIEVWGMQTTDYLESKERRIADYARRKQVLLSWSANPREELPALPAKTSGQAFQQRKSPAA